MGGFYTTGLADELGLYVRQLAWLNARPRPDKAALGKDDPEARIVTMRAAGIVPDMPPNPAPYITEWLLEIGPTVPTGMGSGPIGWRDMEAWSSLTGSGLQPWEARLIRRLSLEFLAWTHKAEKPDCPAPWVTVDDATAANREAVARKVSNAFRAMAMARGAR